MSRSRKHLQNQVLDEFPEPEPHQSIVRVKSTRGTNQIEVEYPNGEQLLVMLPSKFSKLVWTKKGSNRFYVSIFVTIRKYLSRAIIGDFVIIKTDQNTVHDIKIKGMIEHILMPQHVRHLKKIGKWPKEFSAIAEQPKEEEEQQTESDAGPMEFQGNPNRKHHYMSDEEEEDDDDDD